VTTVYLQDASVVKSRYLDMVMESFRISGSQRGPLQYQCSLRGSGSITEGSLTPPALPTLPTPVYLMGNDTDILVGVPASAASIKERVRSWEVEVVSGVEQHRGPGGGTVASFAKIGVQRARVRLRIAAKDSDDLRTLMVNDTLQELQINTNSGAAAQLNFKFHNLYFKMTPVADGNEQCWDLVSEDQDMMKGAGLEPLTVTAINAQATFLVGA